MTRLAASLAALLVLTPIACRDDAPTDPGGPPPVSVSGPAADARVRLGRVADALDTYLKQHMKYPDLLEVLIRDDLAKPADFDDPWGRRIDYTRKAEQAYRLCSRGPDNLPKTEDDVCLPGAPGER